MFACISSVIYNVTDDMFWLYATLVIVIASLLLWALYVWQWMQHGVQNGKVTAVFCIAIALCFLARFMQMVYRL